MAEVQEQLKAIAYGMVQGVSFRYVISRQARSLGIAGYVCNLPDGRSIELCAEGPRVKLLELLHLFRSGPPGARVDRVEETWSAATGEFADFQVRR